jgi:hypothetical protein
VKCARALLLVAASAVACSHGPAVRSEATSATPTSTPTPTPTSTASAPGGASADPQPAAQLAAIRSGVDALLAAQAKLLWELWTKGAAADLEVAGRDALASAENIAAVRAARDRADGDERRALTLLHGFLVGERLARAASASAPNGDAPAIAWEGRKVAVARVPALLAAEPDASRRAALERAWVEAERKRRPLADARWSAIAAAAAELGYGSLAALAAELRGEPTEAFAALAEGVLATTDGAYEALVGGIAKLEQARRLPDLRGRDLPRLFRAADDARAFPAARLALDAQGTLAGMGLDLLGRPGVLLDGERRAGKDPRALALPLAVPGDVRVSFAPLAGAAELRGLLHELGAAAYYSNVTTPVLEFQRLGAITADAWAGLFEDLAGEPGWLARHTGVSESHLAPIVRAAAARRLHRARSLAARVLVELGRARDPAFGGAAAKTVLERAFRHPVDADELELFLAERDPLLESADALRALLIAAQAEAYLAARGPLPWWLSTESGAALAALFADGSRLDPAALARALGAAALDATALDSSSRARAGAAGVRFAER